MELITIEEKIYMVKKNIHIAKELNKDISIINALNEELSKLINQLTE